MAWKTPGGTHKTLEEAVNTCITMALKGKALDPQSEQMKEIIAYIKSLKGMTTDSKPKKKRAIEGC
jgi:cytochrome c